MTALGLQSGNPAHEKLYLEVKVCSSTEPREDSEAISADMLKKECALGYDAVCANRANLRPEYAHVLDKFTYNQMRESAIDAAITQIYRNAHPNVRAWYARWGVDGTGSNFIVRWFLYHLFRNRDARNDRKVRGMNFHDDDDEDDSELERRPEYVWSAR